MLGVVRVYKNIGQLEDEITEAERPRRFVIALALREFILAYHHKKHPNFESAIRVVADRVGCKNIRTAQVQDSTFWHLIAKLSRNNAHGLEARLSRTL